MSSVTHVIDINLGLIPFLPTMVVTSVVYVRRLNFLTLEWQIQYTTMVIITRDHEEIPSLQNMLDVAYQEGGVSDVSGNLSTSLHPK